MERLPNNNPSNLGAFTFNLRFPGQYYDAETNLHYNFHRDYDPSTGRYNESDPVGFAGHQLSTYGYVGGNPISDSDSRGLAPDYSTFLQNHQPVPADTSASSCPTGKCVHTISINHPGVCDGQDGTCEQSMNAAGMQGPYRGYTKSYDTVCLAKLGIFVKGGAAAGGTALGKYGPGILAEGVSAAGAPVAASYLGAGATTLAEISSGPLGIGASIIGAISFLTSECECKGK